MTVCYFDEVAQKAGIWFGGIARRPVDACQPCNKQNTENKGKQTLKASKH